VNRAADWLKQAGLDLQAAEDSCAAGHHEWAAFQAQQSSEKAVKALVQSMHGAVRGHSITEILRQLPPSAGISPPLLAAAQELDKVYFTSRYPNGFASGAPGDYFDERSSQALLAHARQIFEFCRSKIH
jgi:HEPN domain-containing protein